MAHNNYLKSGGIWSLFSLLTSGLMSTLDKTLYKTINGDEGGVWAPHLPGSSIPTPIVIGGDGLQVLGPFLATDAEITITPGKFLTVDAGANLNILTGGFFNLAGLGTITGNLITNAGGTIQIATVGGLQILANAEQWVMPQGVIRLKAGPVFFGPAILLEQGSALTLQGTGTGLGQLAFVNSTNASWLFSSGTTLTWGGLSSAVFAATSTTTFPQNSTLNLQGTIFATSTAAANLAGSWAYGALLATATVQFGAFCTVNLAGGCSVTDSAFHIVNGTWLWNGNLTMVSGSALSLGGTTTITGPVVLNNYAPWNADPGGTNLLAANATVKATFHATTTSGALSNTKSYNIKSCLLDPGHLAFNVTFFENMADGGYLILIGLEDNPQNWMYVTNKAINGFQLHIGSTTIPEKDLTSSDAVFSFSVAVIGQQ